MSSQTEGAPRRYDFIVVGAGPIGASAAKYLAEGHHAVAILRPPAGESSASRSNSHSDHSRIARSVDADPLWSRLAARSIDRYRALEKATGVDFFTEVGSLLVFTTPTSVRPSSVGRVEDPSLSGRCERLDATSLRRQFDYLDFPANSVGFWERTSAGYIDPRQFIEAQIVAGRDTGYLNEIPQPMVSITRDGHEAVVELADGSRLRGDDILLAMGAYSKFEPACAIERQLTIFGRTIAHIEVTSDQARALADMPTVRVRGEEHGFYFVPPIVYPDGKYYLKVGGGPRVKRLESPGELERWCSGSGDPRVLELLVSTATELIPEMTPLSVRQQTCIITVPASGRPYVGRVPTGFGIATGGNGGGAKSGDELGRIAAGMITGKTAWAADYEPANFRPVH